MIDPHPPQLRTAGALCLIAGLLGAASGLVLLGVSPSVSESRYSYPFSAGAFVAIQAWFAVQHLGLLAGQWGLAASGAAGPGRHVRWAHWVGLAGMALLTFTELLAMAAANDPYPSPLTNVLDGLYGISCVAVGVGMTVVGVGVVRHGLWSSWRRWTPVAIGVWVFVPMTPSIMVGYVPARVTITIWMLLYAALGWALVAASSRAELKQAPASGVSAS